MNLRHVVASLGISGFLAAWMVACSGPPAVADYDQTCKVDSDCVAVWSGSCSDACQCPNAAINRSQASQYEGDIQRSGCKIETCTCAPSSASCQAGTCVIDGGGSATSSSSGTSGSSSSGG